VLLLPSVPYEPLWRLHAAGEHPIPTMPPASLRDLGIAVDSIDPGRWPWNPVGRMHPFYRAFDPIRLMRAIATRRRYHLLVSGNDSVAAALVWARRRFGLRMRVLIWDFSPTETWRPRRIVQDRTLPFVDGVLALNEIQDRYIRQRWGAHVPVRVIGHWVDTAFFRPPGEVQDGAGDFILSVGDDEGRDYPTLLAALQGVEAPTRIRSGQTLDLGGLRAARMGRISAPELRATYAAARFVVVPLRRDTRNASGVSTILEAGAMGRAVIVSGSDGVREFVRDGETGLVVPAGDPAALRRAIDRLLAEPETCRRLGLGGRRFVEAIAAPEAFAPRLAAAYRALASPAPR
jgi:glycosyltransferase involved in cell wall biosynthesis